MAPRRARATIAVHVDDILARTKAFEHRLIAGELDKRKLGAMGRSVARAVHAPEGDFRDWDAIEAWAKEIAVALAVSDAPARS